MGLEDVLEEVFGASGPREYEKQFNLWRAWFIRGLSQRKNHTGL